MKVYVLEESAYDDREVAGVFGSVELAKKAAGSHAESWSHFPVTKEEPRERWWNGGVLDDSREITAWEVTDDAT